MEEAYKEGCYLIILIGQNVFKAYFIWYHNKSE